MDIQLADQRIGRVLGVDCMCGGDLKAANTWEQPNRVAPVRGTATPTDSGGLRVRVPGPGWPWSAPSWFASAHAGRGHRGNAPDTLVSMDTPTNLPVLHFASTRDWDNWLAEHHGEPHGVWLRIAKKGCEIRSVSYSEALDVALCHGWIDGQKKPDDGAWYLQKFTPRRPRSAWSRVNTARANALIDGGAMKPAGLAKIEAAKADGRWDAAYAPQSEGVVPADFQAELDTHPEAQAFFATLNKVNRYAIYFRITTAKKPETRRSRIEKFIAMLERKEMLHP